jgi:hypothetical protein
LAWCSSINSWIFLFRTAWGMRLTRISSRVRIPCACNAYCARNLRARSVTADASVEVRRDVCVCVCVFLLLSSCRLSINACFCACVMPAILFAGLRCGVFAVGFMIAG